MTRASELYILPLFLLNSLATAAYSSVESRRSFWVWRDNPRLNFAEPDQEDILNASQLDEAYESAVQVRLQTQDKYPNVNERRIYGLERLRRLAVLAMKLSATADHLDWVDVWSEWYTQYEPLSANDKRTAADRLFAYTVERHTGILINTFDATLFELDFDAEYRMTDEYKDAQYHGTCRMSKGETPQTPVNVRMP